MPELPEVETIRRGLSVWQKGLLESVTCRRPDLRWPLRVDALKSCEAHRVSELRRRAKYLLVDFEHGWTMLFHFGMSGRLSIDESDGAFGKHDHLVFKWRLQNSDKAQRYIYHDPRRFGWIDAYPTIQEAEHPRLCDLGIEPLLASAVRDACLAHRHRKISIKQLLMDAKVVVGVGNIYASEALFRAGVHPAAVVQQLDDQAFLSIATAVQEVIQSAIEQGGTTLRDYSGPDGEPGHFGEALLVYGREGLPCLRCDTPIMRAVQQGRSTYWCPRCQLR